MKQIRSIRAQGAAITETLSLAAVGGQCRVAIVSIDDAMHSAAPGLRLPQLLAYQRRMLRSTTWQSYRPFAAGASL